MRKLATGFMAHHQSPHRPVMLVRTRLCWCMSHSARALVRDEVLAGRAGSSGCFERHGDVPLWKSRTRWSLAARRRGLVSAQPSFWGRLASSRVPSKAGRCRVGLQALSSRRVLLRTALENPPAAISGLPSEAGRPGTHTHNVRVDPHRIGPLAQETTRAQARVIAMRCRCQLGEDGEEGFKFARFTGHTRSRSAMRGHRDCQNHWRPGVDTRLQLRARQGARPHMTTRVEEELAACAEPGATSKT